MYIYIFIYTYIYMFLFLFLDEMKGLSLFLIAFILNAGIRYIIMISSCFFFALKLSKAANV